jgi:F0F1-type ATP synthase assembly protein I
MTREPTARELGYYVALAQTGIEMVVPAVIGFYLDDWLDTTPWITCFAAAFGFAAGLTHLIVILKKKEREESETKPPP